MPNQFENHDGVAKWYCVQTRPKSEHIAAAGLARFDDVEVYCPRIRFQRATKRGKVWFREALFPNYMFVKFELVQSLRAVRSSQAVVRVVGFGDMLGEVDELVIETIRKEMGTEIEKEIKVTIDEGEEVEVAQGPFAGTRGIVTKVLNGEQRVKILMEILGQENQVEVATSNLKTEKLIREIMAGGD